MIVLNVSEKLGYKRSGSSHFLFFYVFIAIPAIVLDATYRPQGSFRFMSLSLTPH